MEAMGSSSKDKHVIDVDNDNDNGKEAAHDGDNQDEKIERSRRSFVWNHFTYEKGVDKFPCPYCKIKISAGSKKNGTSSMGNHLKYVCKLSPLYHQIDNKKQSKLNYKSSPMGDSLVNLTTYKFNQEKCRKSLARMCIKDNRPFSVVDDEGLRDFVSDLNPEFKFPSRWTIARDCLSIYEEEANNLKKILKDQTVCLTTDTWTSVQNFNYMCLTAHWIDEKWTLSKKILNFCQITNHKGITIGKLVYECLREWGIDRVFTITVDNASSNDTAIKYLKTMLKGPNAILDCEYLHLRCCAHIINLVVRDGLEEQNASITKIRNAVKYVRSSPSRYECFKESVGKENIVCKRKPCIDVDTRWNSTYLMLETAGKFAAAFERLRVIDTNYKAYFHSEVMNDGEKSNAKKRKHNDKNIGAPEEDDWDNARYFVEYLRIFYNVTKKVSGAKYVTSNLFFGELVTMHATISKMCLNGNEREKNMALSMKEKYDKYWDNIDNTNFMLHVALVLDSRNKLSYLCLCLSIIYGKNSKKGEEFLNKVKETLNALLKEYKMKAEKKKAPNMTCSSSSTSTNSLFESGLKVDMEQDYVAFLEERGKGGKQTEVDKYLADATEDKGVDLDVLGWWKLNSLKFPILAQVARNVLAMPISTVASESAFSIGGRVIDGFRSSLTPKTAEALICTQDWLQSTPIDLQDENINGLQLQDLIDNLENFETDILPTGKNKKTCYDDFMDEDWED